LPEVFERRFFDWINKSLKKAPDSIKGFAFNLFQYPWLESPEPKYGIELIGSPVFSATDEDWACDEAFEAKPRSLEIPISYSTEEWGYCLHKMEKLVSSYMMSTETGVKTLTTADGVGIGFVDGNLRLLQKPNAQ